MYTSIQQTPDQQPCYFFYSGNYSFLSTMYRNLIIKTQAIIIDQDTLKLLAGPAVAYKRKIVIYTHTDCHIPNAEFLFVIRLR